MAERGAGVRSLAPNMRRRAWIVAPIPFGMALGACYMSACTNAPASSTDRTVSTELLFQPAGMPSTSTTACSDQTEGAACGVGMTYCGGTCVDTNSDPLNCGACGHDCGQGSCSGQGVCSKGVCGVAPVAVGQPPPGAINAKVAYGATGDPNNTTGSDTEAINRAISAAAAAPGGGTVYIPDGTYMIRADRNPPPNDSTFAPFGKAGIQLKSNVTLFLSANAVLRALPTSAAWYSVVVVPPGVSNVTIKGGSIVGDFGVHLTSNIGQACTTQNKMCAAYRQPCLSTGVCGAGEWGMGILVKGASNVHIVGVNVSKMWGDGIDLAYDDQQNFATNVSICGVVADYARRNGVSITGASGVQITDSTFQHAGRTVNGQAGTSPMAGFDVEPNSGTAHDISFANCRFTNNTGSGLLMSGGQPNAFITTNSVRDSVMQGNGEYGVGAGHASHVSVSNCVVQGNKGYGIRLGDRGLQNRPVWSSSIIGNSISGNADGIVSDFGSYGNLIQSNIVSGNHVGIFLGEVSQEKVQGNTIQNSALQGILLGTTNHPATQCSITGNSLNSNGTAMRITNQSSSNTVTGNTCTGVGQALVIGEQPGSTSNTVSMNNGCTLSVQ